VTPITGTAVDLRPVTESDVDDAYVAWLNDPAVNQYLETRFVTHSADDIRQYVRDQARAADAVFLAIVRRSDGRHIGNLRIGAIDRHHRSATIALVIGDRTAWGRGLGSDAITTATRYAFTSLDLDKLTARCYATNLGSIRAFEKAGWQREGVQRGQFMTDAGRIDGVWLGIQRQR
jgi:RimJ/RimL family protein N-acetyltransferase